MTHFPRLITAAAICLLGVTIAPGGSIPAAWATTSPSPHESSQLSMESGTDTDSILSADTSSPRDTLRSFLSNYIFAIEKAQHQGRVIERARTLAYHRALDTLDFSTTPDGDSRTTMNGRMALLHEVLARLDLPPYSDIPGDGDVAAAPLKEWTIPGSAITIARIDKGPRAGEYLFSAYTVQRLERYYRMIKPLPYRPGAVPGTWETVLRSENTLRNREMDVRNRLKPVDTSSPRTTLDGFLDSVNRAYAIAKETNSKLEADPPTITLEDAREAEASARNLMLRAQAALDLSQIPEAIRDDAGIEAVLLLKEILDRMTLPSIEAVPDSEMLKAQRKQLSGKDVPLRWRIPNTSFDIAEIMDGDRQGDFLFTAESVASLREAYKRVRDLPYRLDLPILRFEYTSPGISEGFYEYYINTPEYLIPGTTLLGRFIMGLPKTLHETYNDQTLWQWAALVLCVLLTALVLFLVQLVFRRVSAKIGEPLRHWLILLSPMIMAGIVSGAVDFIDNRMNITGIVLLIAITMGRAITMALWAWVIYGICRAVAESVIALPQIPEGSVRANLLQLSSRVIGALLFAWVFVAGLSELGINVLPLVASLGVGGLAVALAARPTMENIISSFMIYMDKPFRVGQRVRVLGQNGTIESIGLRSTKIRLLTGPLTAIPNEKMAVAEVENIGRRPYIRRTLNVTITYDTPPEKITRAVEILQDILSVPPLPEIGETENQELIEATIAKGAPPALAPVIADIERDSHPNMAINTEEHKPRVYFNELNADSLNILVLYWYKPPKYWDYLEHADWINMQIMERFNAEGIDFAFPTQTLHIAGDDNRPLTVGTHAVSPDMPVDSFRGALPSSPPSVTVDSPYSSQSGDFLTRERDGKKINAAPVEGELTDAPIEDELLDGEDSHEDDVQR